MALSSQSASLTAIANDYGYEKYPARCLEALSPNDTLILLSTSGTSKNIVAVLEWVKGREKAPTILLICGKKFLESPYNMLPESVCGRIVVPSSLTSTIQEATLFILHRIAACIERKVTSR